MTTYIPDPKRYQQLDPIGRYGQYNCTVEGAAFRADAHTGGKWKTTGEAVRAASSEPVPDPQSPGLNLGQADAALFKLSHGVVDLDTRTGSRALNREQVRNRIVDGRFCGMSVKRGVLVSRGYGGTSGFTGSHDITVFTRESEPDVPIIFDPLLPYTQRSSWDAVFDAAEAVTPWGLIFAQFTRDRTPDYIVRIHPTAPATLKPFYTYRLDAEGRIKGSTLHTTRGIDRKCSRPTYHGSATNGISGRYLVQITEGAYQGAYVNARFADEMEP